VDDKITRLENSLLVNKNIQERMAFHQVPGPRERITFTLLVVGILVGIFLLRDLWEVMFWG
jgi:hypothetical protein